MASTCVPPTFSLANNSGDSQPFTSFESGGKLGESVDVDSENDDPADTRATRSFDRKPPIAFSAQSSPPFEASSIVRANAEANAEMRSSLPLCETTSSRGIIGFGQRLRKASKAQVS